MLAPKPRSCVLLAALVLLVAMASSRVHASGSESRSNDVLEFTVVDEGQAGRIDAWELPHLPKNAKKSWPELVGEGYEAAKLVIQREAPDVHVYKVPVGSAVTTDYSLQRVRVFVSEDGQDRVVLEPSRG